ncbi:SPOR domain-containing protein [Flavobacterium sp. GSP27]|uniref:SPOR domain-containing protein n=1 Tax=Flavobacterium bomense TaxID=2497483 RepID=A0A432CRJ8_9FLAO|nr:MULTISPECIES: SPOR domain-containing protein [Flavobacterium]RTY96379.1 SPOR domain-containing protein [Flavobacterium sp. GSN2]RTY70391.1 SPOR domain-containing protein [Flavobacterium sp. LB2P53]RTY76317.1 SPOR domain-containing protein [Flavobacterium sp. LS1R10]RTY81296.1 SPOR domain-containing protein [Flavobacterium sp. ZB4P23]RTY85212.1 SPOR domain-containing protein [Flavobacterium sp. LS1P28]
MKIELYIAQLLYRYQCVTVPGFGAFLTEIQSAKRNESTNSFSPPKKMIAFNANLKNNDGLLANHIALAEKTSYEYAVSAIQYEVFTWKKTLEENELFSIKNVGDLHLNADKNIVFTPYDQTNYLTSSFGLAPFVSPLVKRAIFEKEVEAIEEKATITMVPETRTANPYLKYAAIFVLGLGLAGSVGYPMYQNQIASETILVETAVQKQVQNKIQQATFFIESPVPAVTLSVKSTIEAKMPYHIMAGVYREEKNADKTLRILNRLGYDAKRIAPNRNGYFPVLYGSYATFAEAEKAKKEINEKHNPEAWILIQSL